MADHIYDHIFETNEHIKTRKLFSISGVNSEEIKKNEVALMYLQERVIIREDDTLIADKAKHNNLLKDIAIIEVCIKVKNYEIAAFGSLVSFAKTLGENEIAVV